MSEVRLYNYNLFGLLGEGGMAKVFSGKHKTLGYDVAVKILNGDFVHNSNIRKRFLSEARNLYRLSHPGIVKVTDLIEEPHQVAFVMELIDGETLKQYLDRQGKLPEEQIRELMRSMLDALGYVHRQGLVHRDIKPSNFMLDRNGRVVLMDFGIAKVLDPGSSEYTQTSTHLQMGTPMYMSPEQAENTRDVTLGSDLYSMGVVLWQMSTGSKPYNKDLSIRQLYNKIADEPLPATGLNWDAVISRSTQKDPKRRYESAEEFASALNQVKEAQSVVVEIVPGDNKDESIVPIQDDSPTIAEQETDLISDSLPVVSQDESDDNERSTARYLRRFLTYMCFVLLSIGFLSLVVFNSVVFAGIAYGAGVLLVVVLAVFARKD